MDDPTASAGSTAGLRAFAHPFRLQVLSLLTASAMSAAEVARELDTTQANASYHLRRLHAAGLLEVAEEVSIRGGKARRYRHDPATGSGVRTTGPDDHQAVVAALSAELRRRTSERNTQAPGHMTDAELWVDPATWEAVWTQVQGASQLLHRQAVPPRTPGAIRVNATIMLFQMVDGPAPRPGDHSSDAPTDPLETR